MAENLEIVPRFLHLDGKADFVLDEKRKYFL